MGSAAARVRSGHRHVTIDEPHSHFVSRGGEKLAAALRSFSFDVAGLTCADFGAHTGGFTDCLLQRGAAHVCCVDTCYGTLAWKLRRDPRVTVRERTNAMHVTLQRQVDLIVIDVGWTPQRLILPAAERNLSPGGRVISLIKPHYESPADWLRDGVLPDERLDDVVRVTLAALMQAGWTVIKCVESPLRGHGGNREMLALLARTTSPS